MHYFLIGLPGSGKSTLGRALAEKLSLEVLDTDKLIQKKESLSIEDIFSQKGEAYFRMQEHELLKELIKEKILNNFSRRRNSLFSQQHGADQKKW